MTLAGKRVLITGGGSGAGADLARGFAAAGAEVVIAGRRADALAAVAPACRDIRAMPADVTDEAIASGRCSPRPGPATSSSPMPGRRQRAVASARRWTQWNAMIAVNLTGVFLTFREGLRAASGLGPADRRRLDRRAEGLCQDRALCGGQAWGDGPCRGRWRWRSRAGRSR